MTVIPPKELYLVVPCTHQLDPLVSSNLIITSKGYHYHIRPNNSPAGRVSTNVIRYVPRTFGPARFETRLSNHANQAVELSANAMSEFGQLWDMAWSISHLARCDTMQERNVERKLDQSYHRIDDDSSAYGAKLARLHYKKGKHG